MKHWLGTFGFSYVGLIFLFLLFMPNIAWSKHKPKGYTADGESKVLRAFETVGQITVTCIALCFSDFNLRPLSWRSVFLPPLAYVCFSMRLGGFGILRVRRNYPIFIAVFAVFLLQGRRCLFSPFSFSEFTGKTYGCSPPAFA